MTQIIISDLQSDDLDLQSHDSHPSTYLLKDDQNELISISVKRSLDARKVSGGIRYNIDIGPTCGMVSCEKPY
jgi:hypothetical protein